MSLIIFVLFIISFIDYKSFDFEKRFTNLKEYSSKIYVRESFIFKSKDYKEFVYVK
ncbi:hypothetical protein [Malaciobacter molluscorum]|uniref:hypothetical protein n=1 Tax=Malaciobacter molluscorum TaxID=1032072 RepID=UPI0013EDE8E2|nr:hypothetical protein [Malaciobacter molluscorum]